VHRGLFGAPEAVAVCLAGVVASDLLLFQITRRLGHAALRIERIERMKGARWRRVEQLFQRHGGRLVFAARFVGGLRATTFAVAGVHGMPLVRFFTIDAAAACFSVPLMLGLGYLFADRLDEIRTSVSHVRELTLLLVIAAAGAYLAHTAFQRWRTRRLV
jgi:membrane protein DedA with SNARE-associated domain